MQQQTDRTRLPQPFSLTPDPGFFFLSSAHEAALRCLEQGLLARRVLQILTAAPGQGKTTLLRALAARLGRRVVPVFVSLDSAGTETELFQAVCAGLSVPFEAAPPEETARRIRRHARRLGRKGRTVLLLLDEADPGAEGVWPWLARLWESPSDRKDLAPAVVAGPPGTDRSAAAAAVLRRFPTGGCSLGAMAPEETVRYVLHRLSVSGLEPAAVFSAKALALIVEASGGVPRDVNVICGSVVDICLGAGRWPAEAESVREALRDLALEEKARLQVDPERVERIERILDTARRQGARRAVPWMAGQGTGRVPDGRRAGSGVGGGASGGRTDRGPPPGMPRALPRLGDAGRFLIWFLIVAALLGGGTLLQVLRHDRQVREAKRLVEAERLGATETRSAGRRAPAPMEQGEGDLAEDSVNRYVRDREQAIRRELSEMAPPRAEPAGPARTYRDRDLAGIALDCCGRLDRSLLDAFARANPHVKDWNALAPAVDLTVPDAEGSGAGGDPRAGVDIHSVCLTTLYSRPAAFLAADEINRAGLQNLFVVPSRKAEGRRLYDVCAGVFASEEAAAKAVPQMRRSGFAEARPARIREASLGLVLHPYRRPDPAASSPERAQGMMTRPGWESDLGP